MAVDRRPPRPAPGSPARRCQVHRPASAWGAGACLAASFALAVTTLAQAPTQGLALLAAAGLAVVLGREVAAVAGLLLGGNPWLLAAQILLLEAGLLLALAPRVAGPQPPAVVANAARRRNGARRPTSLGGLYARALLPFSFLGPLVALLMGEAARLPARRIPLVVLAACATATLVWCALGGAALALLGQPGLLAALAVTASFALLGAGVALRGVRREGRPLPRGLRS